MAPGLGPGPGARACTPRRTGGAQDGRGRAGPGPGPGPKARAHGPMIFNSKPSPATSGKKHIYK